MNTILEELQALEQGSRKACPAVRLASELEPEAGEYVLKLLKNRSVSIRQIHMVLKKPGFAIARESLAAHRKGSCGCSDDQ